MKAIKLLILCALFSYLVIVLAPHVWSMDSSGFIAIDRITYFGTTDNEIKVSWDHNDPRPERYEINLFHVERETEGPAGAGSTAENSIVFKLPRSGHFVAKVRACESDTCGDWSESIDPEAATVNGQPRAWWIYGYVDSPGNIVTSQDQ